MTRRWAYQGLAPEVAPPPDAAHPHPGVRDAPPVCEVVLVIVTVGPLVLSVSSPQGRAAASASAGGTIESDASS